VSAWNLWREEHPTTIPVLAEASLSNANLSGANLSGADLSGANLRGALLNDANLTGANLQKAILHVVIFRNAKLNKASLREAYLRKADLSEADLSGADLSGANLTGVLLGGADLSGADLSGAILSEADLIGADLRGADLSGTDLSRANLSGANLSKANLSRADLSRATLVETKMSHASLIQCSVYGITAWKVDLEGAIQQDLVITPEGEPVITVDDLEIAPFIYLLLNNAKIGPVIDTIAKRMVLILGRFTRERRAILNALREVLRRQGYVPIWADVDRPHNRDFSETIATFAYLSRFIIADLTDAGSLSFELSPIVTSLQIPVQPLISESKQGDTVVDDLSRRFPWVLPTYTYKDLPDLLSSLQELVIKPSERKVAEFRRIG
jgi:uncharacterized protein YjbI with pentapeptide repeats